jgi:hypothetical protein
VSGWVSLTAAIVEQALADLELALVPCRTKRKPEWAFTPEHFREFFVLAEDLYRVCGFRLNPEAVRDRLSKKLNHLDKTYATQGCKRNTSRASRHKRKA